MTAKKRTMLFGILLVIVYVAVYFFTSKQGEQYLEKYPWLIALLIIATVVAILPITAPKYKKHATIGLALLLLPAAATLFFKTEFGQQYRRLVPLFGWIYFFGISVALIVLGSWKNPRTRQSFLFGLIFLYITMLVLIKKYWDLPFESLALAPIGILFLAHGIAIARAFRTGNKVWVMNKSEFGGDRMVSPKDQPGTLAFLMILDFSFGLFLLLLAIVLYRI